jgi:hypothetical protein
MGYASSSSTLLQQIAAPSQHLQNLNSLNHSAVGLDFPVIGRKMRQIKIHYITATVLCHSSYIFS